MKKVILLFCSIALSIPLFSQFGITGAYHNNFSPNWNRTSVDGENILDVYPSTGYAFGVDYWFRLKNKRVEFMPQLNASFYKEEPGDGVTFESNMYSFFFNTNIYFLDFAGDCDCPTFSKDGNFVDKGLFLQLSPGISMMNMTVEDTEGSREQESFVPSIAAALGMDIGVADLLTITPFFGIRYYINPGWDEFEGQSFRNLRGQDYEIAAGQDQMFQFMAGLRLGFRFDDR